MLWSPDAVVPEQTPQESPSSTAGLWEQQDPSQPHGHSGVTHVAGWGLGSGDQGGEDVSESSAWEGRTELQVPALAQQRALPKHSRPNKRQQHIAYR